MTSVPVRPPLLTERVIDSDDLNKEGSVQETLEEIERLQSRVDKLARKQNEQDILKVPMIRGPNEPTEEEVERHNLTHSNFKSWCAHCQAGLAQRDKHVRKQPKVQRYSK